MDEYGLAWTAKLRGVRWAIDTADGRLTSTSLTDHNIGNDASTGWEISEYTIPRFPYDDLAIKHKKFQISISTVTSNGLAKQHSLQREVKISGKGFR